MKLTRSRLRSLIESFIAGEEGVLHVPEKDPYEDDEIIHPAVRGKFSREALEDNSIANMALDMSSAFNDKDSDRDVVYNADEYRSMQSARKDPQAEYDNIVRTNKYKKIISDSGLNLEKYDIISGGPRSIKQIRLGISDHVTILSETLKDAEAVRDLLMEMGYFVANYSLQNKQFHFGIYQTSRYNSLKTYAISVMKKRK